MKSRVMTFKKISPLIFSALLISPALSLISNAEEIKVSVGNQSAELDGIDRPKSGMNKTKVAEQFGQPIKENAGRGKPPISSWEYEKFVVYFENDTVIHSVLKITQHDSREVHTKEEVEMQKDSLQPNAPDTKASETQTK